MLLFIFIGVMVGRVECMDVFLAFTRGVAEGQGTVRSLSVFVKNDGHLSL